MNIFKKMITAILALSMITGYMVFPAFSEDKALAVVTERGGELEGENVEFYSENWKVIADEDASGGYYLASESPLANTLSRYDIPAKETIKVKFNVSDPGNYSIYIRVKNPSGKLSYFSRQIRLQYLEPWNQVLLQLYNPHG